MNRLLFFLCAILPLLGLSACNEYGDYGVGYARGPYVYDGWYDDYYGPIYDGYWGADGFFYFRGNSHDQRFRRGDSSHFRHDGGSGGSNFHPMHGQFSPGSGIHLRSFGGNPPAGRHSSH